MSTTCHPDGSLTITPDDAKTPLDEVYIVRVSNGWMLYKSRFYQNQPGCVRHPDYVFNALGEMVDKVRELLGADVNINKITVSNPS